MIAERDSGQISRGPLIGRKGELEYLEKTWAQAENGSLTTPGVIFRGEAGIGKSRLAGAAIEMAEKSHAVILGLFGSPFHTDVGLRPVRRMTRTPVRHQARIGWRRTAFAGWKPRFGSAGHWIRPKRSCRYWPPSSESAQRAATNPFAKDSGGKLYEQIAEGIHGYLWRGLETRRGGWCWSKTCTGSMTTPTR